MKKSLIIFTSLVVMCLGLTGCGAKPETMINNFEAKNNLVNYQINSTLKMGEDTYNFVGEVVNGVSKFDVNKNGADLTNMYITANDFYFGNDYYDELLSVWGELEETDSEYILVKGTNDKINMSNIDFNIVKKYMDKAIKDVVVSYFTANEKLIVVEDDVATINLTGEAAQKFVSDIMANLNGNVNTIYDEIIAGVPENMQNKYKSSREKNTKKLVEYFNSLASDLALGDNANVVLKNKLVDGVYQETLSFIDSTKNIVISTSMSQTGTAGIPIPENYVNITDLKPLSQKEQAAQLEVFFEKNYPKAAEMKKDLLTLGYDEATYTTSLDGITLYTTRPSKSLNFNYGIVDEISIELMGEWLSEISIVSCVSKEDYQLYGQAAINKYIEEMEGLINADFLIEIGDGLGSYENIVEAWEFYATISEITIKDKGLVTIELTAKQH